MSSTYLVKTATGVVVADPANPGNGKATVSISPDGNQFWAVSTVRVSASTEPQISDAAKYPYCAVYTGAASLGASPTTFLDDTLLGSGDATSIISGTITQYGESITAQWTFANIGDTVTLTVYGRSYDNLVELQSELAPIPGARFAGTLGNANQFFQTTYTDTTSNNLFSTSSPHFTVATPFNVEFTSLKFFVQTSAVAGNRYAGVQYRYPGSVAQDEIVLVAPVAQPQSTGIDYTFAEGLSGTGVTGSPVLNAGLPEHLIVPGGTKITGVLNNAQAGDSWGFVSLTYRSYMSYLTASYL